MEECVGINDDILREVIIPVMAVSRRAKDGSVTKAARLSPPLPPLIRNSISTAATKKPQSLWDRQLQKLLLKRASLTWCSTVAVTSSTDVFRNSLKAPAKLV